MKSKFACLALGLALALAPALPAESKDKPMTAAEADKMIADLPAVQKWLEARGKAIDADSKGNLPSALLAEKDFKAFMAAKGWTVERFAYVTSASFYLLAVIEMEKQNPDTAKQFDDAIAQIQASELSADEKAANVKTMQEAKAQMLGLSQDKDINQAELALVRARYDALLKLSQGLK